MVITDGSVYFTGTLGLVCRLISDCTYSIIGKKKASETSFLCVCKYHKHTFCLLLECLVCANWTVIWRKMIMKRSRRTTLLCWQREPSPISSFDTNSLGNIGIYFWSVAFFSLFLKYKKHICAHHNHPQPWEIGHCFSHN